ncbi:MAG: hypothetical protein KGZ80_02380 [Methylomonas sp.]|nr:hypothetical protein [Methylomonas sp.]PPD19760.1 MAG: hypothetical protein CTY23_10905 [Methylomonas sp.]PPD25583.1 MAG: hypothetical protein CTY22_08055 [Methylomonas sp.]PPD36483.1 MAG: hypothetical protein CTY21_08055 [Methylomonas sp.]PPD40960.1 MAG: hypothetical protein CTY17_04915 [Methylomonas sp.]
MIDDAPAFRLFTAFEIRCRQFDGEWLVYHAGTGDTHCLQGDTAALFADFYNHPSAMSAEKLYDAYTDLAPADIDAILASLTERHLIKRVEQGADAKP